MHFYCNSVPYIFLCVDQPINGTYILSFTQPQLALSYLEYAGNSIPIQTGQAIVNLAPGSYVTPFVASNTSIISGTFPGSFMNSYIQFYQLI